MTLLDRTLTRLRAEFDQANRAQEFEQLKGFLTADRASMSYAETARALGKTDGAARVAIHRLRKRFREVFREEIAHTVAAEDDVEDEVRYLMSVLSA
jgi:RNA polymerase sigma-70 factor (ECF subfamily)